MKKIRISFLSVTAMLITATVIYVTQKPKHVIATATKGCVFRTVFGEDPSESMNIYNTPENVTHAIVEALGWIIQAQDEDGGWGSGTHAAQNIMDPHAVKPDPATTAMVCMAILRSGSTLSAGEYSAQLKEGLRFILEQVENSDEGSNTITSLTGTQIQTKLGTNIDVILAAQFLSNILEYANCETQQQRIKDALQACIDKIQKLQTANGSFAGSGWAGVLQSSFASSALESAKEKGVDVDEEILDKAKDFQKGNYNANTGAVNTELGAGVVLYSVSGSVRNASADAKKVREDLKRAEEMGEIPAQGKAVSVETLEQIGYSRSEAEKYSTAYNVYNSAKVTAQQERVMNGFGSNGGEEFLSFLQTGESMVINHDSEWKKWYDNVSGKLISIQNEDGSWSGHHCITSLVLWRN
jgi:hypothetical protein